jgi:hypothetical protein
MCFTAMSGFWRVNRLLKLSTLRSTQEGAMDYRKELFRGRVRTFLLATSLLFNSLRPNGLLRTMRHGRSTTLLFFRSTSVRRPTTLNNFFF